MHCSKSDAHDSGDVNWMVHLTVDIIAHSKVSDNGGSIVPSFPIQASYGRMRAAEGAERAWGGKHTLRLAVKSDSVLSLVLSKARPERSRRVEELSKGGTYVV